MIAHREAVNWGWKWILTGSVHAASRSCQKWFTTLELLRPSVCLHAACYSDTGLRACMRTELTCQACRLSDHQSSLQDWVLHYLTFCKQSGHNFACGLAWVLQLLQITKSTTISCLSSCAHRSRWLACTISDVLLHTRQVRLLNAVSLALNCLFALWAVCATFCTAGQFVLWAVCATICTIAFLLYGLFVPQFAQLGNLFYGLCVPQSAQLHLCSMGCVCHNLHSWAAASVLLMHTWCASKSFHGPL